MSDKFKPPRQTRGYGGQKQGWLKLKNPNKFVQPLDEYMNSYKDGYVQYKSSLEQKAFQYQDNSESVLKWSQEPFAVRYLKPSTQKYHRYYIDLLLVTNKGAYLIEIKPKNQTVPPKPPRRLTERSKKRYLKQIDTYKTNMAKWKAQDNFQKSRNMEFLIFTEDQLT